ncbi:MAG TPA: DUF2182 domain-containing protein [Rhizomicrobium sp.]|jgi:predicted metal-binding membrane protein|nr:DUF2182 domain-containing protein [Rhizomicrobium sp.]
MRRPAPAAIGRDRLAAALALAAIVLLAWAYLFWLQDRMADMDAPMPDMPGMAGMEGMAMPAAAWSPAHTLFIFAMWAVMMAGMMTPSAAPMILIYERVAGQAKGAGFAPTAWFAGGYLLAWTLFSLAATAAQYALDRMLGLTAMMALQEKSAGGILLIAAGVYQWTPPKQACLAGCRAPLAFIQRHGGFRPGALASLRLGLVHGLYCIGCCWALMALLFVGGVMNLAWIAALMIFVLLEKLAPLQPWFSRAAGLAAVAAGAWMALR